MFHLFQVATAVLVVHTKSWVLVRFGARRVTKTCSAKQEGGTGDECGARKPQGSVLRGVMWLIGQER